LDYFHLPSLVSKKFAIRAGAQLRAVVLIVVEDNPNIFGKLSIVGDLNDTS